VALDLEAGLDRLYEAELADFVGERTQLTRALKEEGRRAEASRVEELRKPSLPAWTVNQLVRRRRKDVDALLAAGEQLEQAQRALLAGGGRSEFDAARKREGAALDRLRDDAVWVLGARASDATLERVVSTLASAAVTESGRAQLLEARLTGDIAPRGFDAFAASAPAPAPPRRKAPAKAAAPRDDGAARRTARQAAVAAAQEKLRAARDREAELTDDRRAAERGVKDARKALEAAVRRAERLEADRAAAAEAVAAARRELAVAKKS
jgi:hypothetical protein